MSVTFEYHVYNLKYKPHSRVPINFLITVHHFWCYSHNVALNVIILKVLKLLDFTLPI